MTATTGPATTPAGVAPVPAGPAPNESGPNEGRLVERLRRGMVDGLAERGELSQPWRPAFERVARHEFLPDTVWRLERRVSGPDLLPLHRSADPVGWLEHAYANVGVATQVDDGHPDPDGRGREITSSASMPGVVAQMLTALDVTPGMRVLEIGTGTGYNAALLAHRLGAENVVSVEVDPDVAERARARLAAAGYGRVEVITADGAAGHPPGAPYDRVIATVAARTVPYEWIAQTRPGGLVLTPWGSEWWSSALLRLDVETAAATTGDATGAAIPVGRGRIVGPAAFMVLRAQRLSRWSAGDVHAGLDQLEQATTQLHPARVATADAGTAIGFRLPGVQQFYVPADDGGLGVLHVVDQASRSWAGVTLAASPPYPVEQAGPRRLWNEVETAYQHWCDLDRPAAGDWTVTVTADGQSVGLRS